MEKMNPQASYLGIHFLKSRYGLLTPSSTAQDILYEKGKGKDDGGGTKRCQPEHETSDAANKGEAGSHGFELNDEGPP